MTNLRLVAPWVAAAALLVGLGSDPGADDRAPVSDDPVTRIERALPVSSLDKVGDAPEAPGLPQGDAGPIRLGALAAVVTLTVRRGSVNRLDSSPPPGSPGRVGTTHCVLPGPSRPAATTVCSTRPGARPTGRRLSTCSARFTTRTQENAP